MGLYFLAVTHHTASSRDLESVYLDVTERDVMRSQLHSLGISVAFIATCNRFELIANGPDARLIHQAVTQLMARMRAIPDSFWDQYAVTGQDHEVVSHLFHVACGMDSMIIGEDDILAQVKQSYAAYAQTPDTHSVLHKVFQSAVAVGKRARHETSISKGSYSVSSLAIDWVRKDELEWFNRSVLMVGAGVMGIRTLKKFHALGHPRLTLVNRTDAKADRLAHAYGVSWFPYHELRSRLTQYELVFFALASPKPIVTPEWDIRGVRLFIDMGMPRNIAPSIEGAKVITVDHLKTATDATVAKRREEMIKVSLIIEEELGRFEEWRQHRDVVMRA
ncbi:glutamyl-tRNA reductase [bacterium]|nr:glutamyl-tRNA reductase [bacterium]